MRCPLPLTRNIAPDPHERDILGRVASASSMRSLVVLLPEDFCAGVTLRSITDLHAQEPKNENKIIEILFFKVM